MQKIHGKVNIKIFHPNKMKIFDKKEHICRDI